MLKCIAIDDEPLALELLEDNISKVPYLQLVALCSNAFEAMKVLEKETVDLVFCDIQMPGLTGLQFIQTLSQKPMFIMITAYEKFALDGYSLDVLDYLVKPVSVERFIKACNKAKELHALKQKNFSDAKPDYIFLNVDYKLLKIVLSDIMWIEGLKDYVKIHLKSTQRAVITRISMKAMEEQLPSAEFIRIHKSYIVSVSYITAIMKNSLFIGEVELPVSDNYKTVLASVTGKTNS